MVFVKATRLAYELWICDDLYAGNCFLSVKAFP
jgi:hypothetical protein